MNYTLKNKITQVKNYAPYKNSFVYGDENNKLYYDSNSNLIIDNIDASSIYLLENNLIMIYNLEKDYYYFYNEKLTKKSYLVIKSNKTDFYLAQTYPIRITRGVYKKNIVLIDKNNLEIKDEIKRDITENLVTYTNEIFLTQQNNTISSYHLPTAQPLWQFDLAQFGTFKYGGDDLAYEVVQYIGIWQNKLLVQLTNARLIALDINSGELLHDIPINKTNPLPEKKAYYDQYTKMHLVEDKIIWLTNQTLVHIDLNTFTVKTIKEFYSQPRENQWRFMHNIYHKGNIYFTADYAWQYVTPSYVGVMDATTGEVLWSQQLENTGGLQEPPKVTNDKLYIRTNNSVLHIFEKDQNAIT